jgi:hypothetical protein
VVDVGGLAGDVVQAQEHVDRRGGGEAGVEQRADGDAGVDDLPAVGGGVVLEGDGLAGAALGVERDVLERHRQQRALLERLGAVGRDCPAPAAQRRRARRAKPTYGHGMLHLKSEAAERLRCVDNRYVRDKPHAAAALGSPCPPPVRRGVAAAV